MTLYLIARTKRTRFGRTFWARQVHARGANCSSHKHKEEKKKRRDRSPILEIGNSDKSFHFVPLAGREINGKIGNVAGLDAEHLHPLVIRKIRQRM